MAASADTWNEDDLRAAIVSVWGEHGAHVDVFDHILRLARAQAQAERADATLAKLREAAEQRRQEIALLQACQCLWPIHTMRNGSGHADDCPAHALWKRGRGYVG